MDEFIQATGASPETAQQYLQKYRNVGEAIKKYKEFKPDDHRRVMTFRDLNDRKPTDLFNGGERSGLAVTNPGNQGNGNSRDGNQSNNAASNDKPASMRLIDEIIRQAQQPQEEIEERPADGAQFHGRGARLGTETEPRNHGSDGQNFNNGNDEDDDEEELPLVKRTLTFWADGFSVEDGPLYRFDDPRNEHYLRAINFGQAPIQLMGVHAAQPVEVEIVHKPHQNYIPPKINPSLNNSGPGQRLGTAVSELNSLGTSVSADPSSGTTSTETPTQNATQTQTQTQTSGNANPNGNAANSSLGVEGDAAVQIRFIDGTARRLRFDSNGPVQQLYDYADQFTSQPYTLSLTRPPQPLTNHLQTLREAGCVNSAILQRPI